MSISLAGTLPLRSSSLPGITGDELSPPADRLYPCLALLRKGVAWPPVLLLAPVVSYTTFSPSPTPDCSRGAVYFCGPILHLTAHRVLPGNLLSGARTFLGQLYMAAPIRPAWRPNITFLTINRQIWENPETRNLKLVSNIFYQLLVSIY